MLLKGIGKDKDFFDVFKPSSLATYGLMAKEAFTKTIEPYYLEGLYHQRDLGTDLPLENVNTTMNKEEFEARYNDELEYDPNMTSVAAEYILDRRKKRAANEYLIEKGKDSIVDYVVEFGVVSAMSVFDPLILYSALLPVSSPAFVKNLGKLGEAIYQGSMSGFIGGTLSEPARIHGAMLMQDDYTLFNSMENIAFSSIGGGIVGGGIYGARKLLSGLKNLDLEKLHIAKEQLEDGKALNLGDPKNAKSIYEAYPEKVQFNKVDEELKLFYAQEFKNIDLNVPEIRSKAIDEMRFAKNADFIKQHASVKIGFQELLHNTELRQKSISRKYLCDFYSDLDSSDLVHHFREMQGGFFKEAQNKKLELDCIRELSNLSLKTNKIGFTGSKIALDLANIIHKHQTLAVDNANMVGSSINWLDGYITRQTHSAKVLKEMGFAEWRDFIVPLLDLERTGNIDLQSVYTNLATGILEK